MFGWPRKSRSISGLRGTLRYWWLCLMDFHNFFSIYVFGVKESIADIPTELPCLDDLKNLGQLPVWEVLWGTDDCVLWIFTISLIFMFSGSRKLLTFLLSYVFDLENSRSISGLRGTLRYWWLCLMDFHNFFIMFWGQGIHCWHSYGATLHGWPSKPLEPEVVLDFWGPQTW